jgi:mono/diheme cytochrome c family protein
MKWRCPFFVLVVGAIGFGTYDWAHGQGNSAAPQASKPSTQAPILPPVQVPPPAILQAPPPQAPGTTAQPALDGVLAFDKDMKEVGVPNGTTEAHFSFNLTNISSGDVTINFVQTSCGCTVAKLPSQPWKLSPNEHGEISATMQLAGVPAGGNKTKTLTVNSDKGTKVLSVRANVLPAPAAMTEMDRAKNLKVAQVDRQAVFKGECASCHVTPAKDAAGHDKMGQELYTAVCGVCHDSEHRASFVANLHKLSEPTSPEFWRNWITHGKPGTLMPAFAKAEGGILTDEQINSVVQFLSATIPSHPAVVAPAAPTALKVQ